MAEHEEPSTLTPSAGVRGAASSSQHPATRLYWSGVDALDDEELLALQLGSRGAAREALAAYGSLAALAGLDPDEFVRIKGVGPATAARLTAAFEITRRLRARVPGTRRVLDGPADVYAAFGALMEDLPREGFRIALLDAKNALIRDVVISEGTLSASLVHPREVFKPAILANAASVILLHNHPSGDATPSQEDKRLTRQLVECARLLDLRIHDHLIVGRGQFASMAEQGLLG